jgi:hypothetical protein
MMKPTKEPTKEPTAGRATSRRGLRRAVTGLALAAAIPVVAATSASAATAAAPSASADGVRPMSSPCSAVSCVYNYHGSSVPVTCVQGTGCPANDTVYLSNSYQVYMECWFTGPNFTGNYTSNRWFGVDVVPLAGEWVVHSSYVYNQTTVGGC